ncbi:glutathione synthase [Gloeobacter violaceus]|uniref:Glutathione synthetase n=1 Tax=Gloeobacter violaceus (strain ATCC 29082 / PCC 7421) TaxID=251221 RepID=GSHB_GLOVI|nr:glutathione synthase [Gloeobacter violaceus]Q7NF44.1 RecName: Full=Glutathione synthetase; AltName: Full=GSH synthetase; Short=GSH-S; Short=GSHase; AltName: Full=Glutathione synthase [Gloeobacter violaceus PCC 7421]BAC91623.1 glutathione synthetase [Gloeobacter violaceus PCC 7421]
MKILFIVDPLETLKPGHDTSVALMQAAARRGHSVWAAEVGDLQVHHHRAAAQVRTLTIHPGRTPFYTVEAVGFYPLSEADVIWMRKDPPVTSAYLWATQVLDLVNAGRGDGRTTFVLNRPSGLRNDNEKLYALHFPDLVPETRVCTHRQDILDFVDIHGRAVIKPLDGKGGEGIFLLARADRNLNAIIEASTAYGTRHVMVQRYLEESRQGDKRIVLLAGEPIGALLRVPREDDVRGNMAAGGRVVKTTLTERDREICRVVGPRLVADGHYFVGIDVIGAYLTEINVTSPTGICEIDVLDGVVLEDEIVDWLVEYTRPALARNL